MNADLTACRVSRTGAVQALMDMSTRIRYIYPLRVFRRGGPTHAAYFFGSAYRLACGRKLRTPNIETDPRDGAEPTCRGCRERFGTP